MKLGDIIWCTGDYRITVYIRIDTFEGFSCYWPDPDETVWSGINGCARHIDEFHY